jgi:hypothetical protein
MKQLKIVFPALLLLCTFCNNDEGPTADEILADLTSGPWVQSEYWVDPDHDGVFEDGARPCEKDDHWDFKADGLFELRENGDPCDPTTGLITFYGIWTLPSTESRILHIELANGFVMDDYNIVAINDTLLEIHYIDPGHPTIIDQKFVLRR